MEFPPPVYGRTGSTGICVVNLAHDSHPLGWLVHPNVKISSIIGLDNLTEVFEDARIYITIFRPYLWSITMSPLPDVSLGNDEPLYNIGVVARMTGVSMATLRAWERRYDFPDTNRTAGGHRLYSERDVLRLRWVKDRIDDGMQTSQAIQALRHQEQVGNLALIEQLPSSQIQRTGESSTHYQTYEKQLYKLLVEGELSAANTLLAEAIAIFYPEDLILNVIRPVLVALGDAWEAGEISVATEHLATNYLRQRL